ncbi:MAG: hypothetical protein H7233_01565 [Pseudorhodobacter sp.]|nr:hypothetical protein [Frankiaceae bacterium]
MARRLPVLRLLAPLALAASTLVVTSGASLTTASATPGNGRPEVTSAVHHDTSGPLRGMPSKGRSAIQHEHPAKPLPFAPSTGAPDGALQTTPTVAVTPTGGLNFAGVGSRDYGFVPNSAPPDTSGAVGATQYVQWVNESFAVFNKATGAIAAGFPKAGNTLWSGFGGGCEVNNDGDPIAQYDKAGGRWVLTQFSVSTPSTDGYLQCVAVSTTSDATGTYNRYSFSYGSTQFNDYPKLGVWPDGYYVTYNIFNGNTFAGTKACAFDRSKMLTGATATQVCFQLGTSYAGLLPSDVDGTIAPPTGSPNYLLNFGTNALNLWKFHVDFAVPASSTLSSTPTSIPVAAFNPACGGGTCIPQPNTSQKLDSLADRLMYRLAYRHFRDGHEALVVNQSVKVSGTKRSEVDGVRWYELRNPVGTVAGSPAGTPSLYQQGTYSPDGTSRWMGSIAMDKVGNIAMGYSASSSTLFPSIRYTGRVPTDPLGTMQPENTIVTGGGSQLANLARWGDYSAMSVDPVDDCTFWFTSEYLKSSGTFNWSTKIASFKMPNC